MAARSLKRHCARFSMAAFALLVVACAPNQGPERVVEVRSDQRPAPRGTALLQTTMMSAHHDARRAVGVAPLTWDEALVGSARTYAQELARTRRFAHADQPHGPSREGENLWTGTRDAYTYSEMIGHWVAERRDFVDAPTPGFSRTGKPGDVAHYTQIVWRGSTRVGCATASNARDDYLVCRYSPAGNVVGERVY